jgi:uncharacterized protein (UPF0264 family)
MRLLVSVAQPGEALAALAGGADVIDAKDPQTGALGAVSVEVLREISRLVDGRRPLTAALGDAVNEGELERSACEFAAAGAALVKVGFAGILIPRRVEALITAAVRGANRGNRQTGVIAVAYADADRVASISHIHLIEVARDAGARGLLLDTANKEGPGLPGLVTLAGLRAWVSEAHDEDLLVALAGQLTAGDLSFVRDAGADIAGVRGAACVGGRNGQVTAQRVQLLRDECARISEAPTAPSQNVVST